MGTAGARPGRRAAGPLHRGRPDLAPLPRGQRVGGAGGCPGRRGRVDQARLDRLRPARRDLAPRCAALPQRRRHLPPGRTPAPDRAPDQVADLAGLRHGRRARRHGQHERHGTLARAVPPAGPGRRRAGLLDPRGPGQAVRPRWNRAMLARFIEAFGVRTADEWETALLAQPAAVAKCNSLAEWLAHDRPASKTSWSSRRPGLGRVPLVGPPVRIAVGSGGRRPGRRHGAEQGAVGGHRIIDLSSFGPVPWPPPAGRAGRRRREGGAAWGRGRVPDDAGAAQHLCRRQSLEAGDRPRPQDP